MRYKHTVMGGTFDRLHKGHISNLKTAFESGEAVTIGLTTEPLHTKKVLAELIQPYEIREEQLRSYIEKMWPGREVTIEPIADIFGPSITSWAFDSLVVTKETAKNGRKINERRARGGLIKLDVITAPWLVAKDGGALSSTRIRSGEIDREGFVYESLFKKTLYLPDNLREEFKKAPGEVVSGAESDPSRAAKKAIPLIKDATLVIAVGDIVSHSLKGVGHTPDVTIIDHKNQRKPFGEPPEKHHAKNEHGTIDKSGVPLIAAALRSALTENKKASISIDGEEDLLVPPAILLAPLGSVVLHGQIGEGIVITPVTEEKKAYIRSLLERFETR